MRFATVLCTGLLVASLGCNRADQERAREKADEARDETVTAARKLGSEAEAKAKELNEKLGKSLNGQHPGGSTGTEAAEDKLDHAAAVARRDGRLAGAKLNHAGMLAKVKAKLVNDVGLATVSAVDVDVRGPVVTLNGTVSSEDQKRQAERSAMSVDGVSRVVNNLTVQP